MSQKYCNIGGENMGKYNIGDRFEIEISEIINDAVAHIGPYYKIKGFDSFALDENGLDRLKEVEEKETTVDWSKVEVDTPVLVKGVNEDSWLRRYFAKYEDGRVYTWRDGATSWSVENKYSLAWCAYAKLAEEEE